jgi:hypothetical protein
MDQFERGETESISSSTNSSDTHSYTSYIETTENYVGCFLEIEEFKNWLKLELNWLGIPKMEGDSIIEILTNTKNPILTYSSNVQKKIDIIENHPLKFKIYPAQISKDQYGIFICFKCYDDDYVCSAQILAKFFDFEKLLKIKKFSGFVYSNKIQQKYNDKEYEEFLEFVEKLRGRKKSVMLVYD